MTTHVAIYGAGGFAREVAWLAESCPETVVACFIDDNAEHHGTKLNDIPIMSLETAARLTPRPAIVVAVGDPRLRAKLAEKAAAASFAFATLIHPRTVKSRWIEIGLGTVICAGNIFTTNISLGHHVQVNLDCTIGHDVVMGDFATLAPGVHISGCVRIGPFAYFGTGAVVINGTPDKPVIIGQGAVVGAGAVVTKSVAAGMTVTGVPARPLEG